MTKTEEALKPTISGPFYSCDDCLEYGDGNCYPPKGLRVWEGRVYCKDCFDTGPGEGSDGLDWDEAEPFPDTTRTPESQEIRYRFPQSVIDYLKSAVKIFGSLSAEQDEQLGLKGGGYMSLESLLRRAETLPEGQEMFAMEHQGDGHLIMAHWVESVVLREAHEGNHDSQHEVYKVVSVLVTKKTQ